MSKFTDPMMLALLLACASMTASAAPTELQHEQCQARGDGADSPESPVRPADADAKPAAKSRLLLPPGMNPRWHSFLPGMFR